ncbi:hypothetical protein ACHQM5_017409 [Ranunculus cassubicifolius]
MRELRGLWRLPNPLEIRPRGNNKYACNFASPHDKIRVEENQPCTIFKKLVLMKPFSYEIDPEKVNFNSVPVTITF